MASGLRRVGEFDEVSLLGLRARGQLGPGQRLPAPLELAAWLSDAVEARLHSRWGTGLYAAYRRAPAVLGAEIVWGEPGAFWTFLVPEGQRQRQGMLLVDVDVLEVDERRRRVAVRAGAEVQVAAGLVQDTRFRLEGAVAERLGSAEVSLAFFKFCDGRVNGWHGSLVSNTEDPMRERSEPVFGKLEARHAWSFPIAAAVVG